MATPCVAGTIALMLSKDRELTPAQIDEILETTAVRLSTHKNNDFGSGRIDALAAVNAVGDDGIDEINNEDLVVYPNPSKGIIFVKTCHNASLQSEYRIINLLGETISSGKISSETQKVDVLDLPDGIYLLKIHDKFLKFVIEK